MWVAKAGTNIDHLEILESLLATDVVTILVVEKIIIQYIFLKN